MEPKKPTTIPKEDAEQLERTIDVIGQTIQTALTLTPAKPLSRIPRTPEEEQREKEHYEQVLRDKKVSANLLPAEQKAADDQEEWIAAEQTVAEELKKEEEDTEEEPLEPQIPDEDAEEPDPERPNVDYIFTDAILHEIPAYSELVSFLTQLAPALYRYGERISKSKSARRGRKLEDEILQYLVNNLDNNKYHIYPQVLYRRKRLDIIVTTKVLALDEWESGISDETLADCVFISVKTAVKNDWANDWEAANKAKGYILYTYGKNMGQGRTYPNSASWNEHIKNDNALVLVHCPDFIRPDDDMIVQVDEDHNLRDLVKTMLDSASA